MWNVASVMLWQDLSVECGICYVVAGLECGMWHLLLWQDLSVECGICYVVVAGLECGMWHLLCYGRT